MYVVQDGWSLTSLVSPCLIRGLQVLRAVVSDVVNIEDSLRDIPASKTGTAR